jgi:hypothetical protein
MSTSEFSGLGTYNFLSSTLPANFTTPHWMVRPGILFLDLSKDKLTIKCTGKVNHINDMGCAISDQILSGDSWVGYYEITILNGSSHKASISVGLAHIDFPGNHMPGMDSRSFGYYGEDGRKYKDGGKGTNYGSTFGHKDTIGCGYNSRNHEIFFTVNGKYQGVAFQNVTTILHPTYYR